MYIKEDSGRESTQIYLQLRAPETTRWATKAIEGDILADIGSNMLKS